MYMKLPNQSIEKTFNIINIYTLHTLNWDKWDFVSGLKYFFKTHSNFDFWSFFVCSNSNQLNEKLPEYTFSMFSLSYVVVSTNGSLLNLNNQSKSVMTNLGLILYLYQLQKINQKFFYIGSSVVLFFYWSTTQSELTLQDKNIVDKSGRTLLFCNLPSIFSTNLLKFRYRLNLIQSPSTSSVHHSWSSSTTCFCNLLVFRPFQDNLTKSLNLTKNPANFK